MCTHIKLKIIINGILYIVSENAKCIWMSPLVIKHLLSQKSRVLNDEFRSNTSQVKAYLCRCVRLHLLSMTFDLIAEIALLGELLCNLYLVISAFLLFTDHQQRLHCWKSHQTASTANKEKSAADLSTPRRRRPWPPGYETPGAMAAWHRITAFSSLLQVGLLLLLLSARSCGRPLEKCPGDKSCQPPRPPVVLSKCFHQCFTWFVVWLILLSVDKIIAQLTSSTASDAGWYSR